MRQLTFGAGKKKREKNHLLRADGAALARGKKGTNYEYFTERLAQKKNTSTILNNCQGERSSGGRQGRRRRQEKAYPIERKEIIGFANKLYLGRAGRSEAPWLRSGTSSGMRGLLHLDLQFELRFGVPGQALRKEVVTSG